MTKKKWHQSLLSSPWGTVLLAFGCAAVLAALIFPEYLLHPELEFCLNTFHADYWGSFTLTNFFYQGGIQLWDPYDQLPLAYYYLIIGVFKFFNVLVALVYIMFSGLSSFQAEFFHHVYSVVFFLSNIFLKIVGSYLLFRKFSSSRLVPALASIYFSVICSAVPFVSSGLSYGSYVPLLVYFTFNVFEYFRLKDILCWVLFYSIVLADHPLHALYLYQGIHFMVLACIIWAVSRAKKGVYKKIEMNNEAIMGLSLTAAACLILLVPLAYMFKAQMGDVDYSDHSRILKLWDWHYYFTREMSSIPLSITEFLSSLMVNTSVFAPCGFAVFAFGLLGLLISKDTRKYIILAALVFMWMLDHPRDHVWGFCAHALNFLTNPLNFAVRIFHEFQLYFLPVWLLSLAVIGVESFQRLLNVSQAKGPIKDKLRVFAIVLVVLLIMALPHMKAEDRAYCLAQFAIVMTGGYFYFFAGKRPAFLPFLIALFIVIEAGVMICYDRYRTIEPYLPRLHEIEAKPEAGLVGINYQNPRILPYREYFDLSVYDEGTNPYLFSYRVENVPGMFFRYTNLARNFFPAEEAHPKHRAYAFWDSDGGQMAKYLSKDLRLVFSADYAVRCSDEAFNAIAQSNLSRTVVSVCDDDGRLNLPAGINVPAHPEEPADQYSAVKFDTDQYVVKDGYAYGQILARPDLWPAHYATTFLTKDQDYIQFYIKDKDGVRKLKPAQGQIVAPDTFDFNNVRQGYFTVAFLPQEFPLEEAYVLTKVPKREGIVKITQWQSDNFGFDYVAPRNRWLVFHYPYDPKWEISVDGHKVKFYRVNKSFMGLPIQRGEHHILLRYWPHTPLRWMLLISMLLATGILILLIHLGLYDRAPASKPTT